MSNITPALKAVVLLSMAIILSQCAAADIAKTRERTTSVTKPSDIASEIKRFQRLTGDPDPSVRARAHLRLATLYSSYKNPNPDYRQALNELEIYLAGDPPEKESYGMKNWHSLLLELVREMDENSRTRQTAVECAKENRGLKDILEQLKNLDLEMEEERGKIK